MPTRDEICWERDRRARLKAEQSLAEYIRQAWPVIEPATTYIHNWHIDALSEYLHAVDLEQILRLVINMPPRHMKSTAVTICWPTWSWISKPWTRWLFASYSAGLATEHSTSRRTIIDSEWYQSNWGDRYQFTDDQNLKTEYRNTQRGMMTSVGFDGGGHGKGGNRVVIDDPHNPKEALSDVQRASAIQTFNLTFATRLNDLKRDAIVIVMQRLHEKDLAGHCKELGYEMLVLPAEAPTRTVITLPVSGTKIVREEGELLWPERQGPAELNIQKAALLDGYSGQYNQDPSPQEGGLFKKWWWRFWVPEGQGRKYEPVRFQKADGEWHECLQVDLPPQFDMWSQSWDMTFKDTKKADFVVGQVWGRKGVDCFLMDQVRERMTIVKTIEALKELSERWPRAIGKLIEDKANGPAVIQLLTGKVAGLLPVEPEGGKVARANAVAPLIAGGNVYLPHPSMPGYSWVWDFIDEFAKFPNAANDDQVDSTSQQLNRWGLKSGWGI